MLNLFAILLAATIPFNTPQSCLRCDQPGACLPRYSVAAPRAEVKRAPKKPSCAPYAAIVTRLQTAQDIQSARFAPWSEPMRTRNFVQCELPLVEVLDDGRVEVCPVLLGGGWTPIGEWTCKIVDARDAPKRAFTGERP